MSASVHVADGDIVRAAGKAAGWLCRRWPGLARLFGRDEVEGLAALAAVKAARAYDPARVAVPYASYAVAAARLALLDEVRKRAVCRAREAMTNADPLALDRPVSDPGPADDPAGLLAGLPAPERAVLEALYVAGETWAALGRRLGVGMSQIERLRAAGLARLRRRLEGGAPCRRD